MHEQNIGGSIPVYASPEALCKSKYLEAFLDHTMNTLYTYVYNIRITVKLCLLKMPKH